MMKGDSPSGPKGWDFTFQGGAACSIPGRGDRIPHASWPKGQKVKQKQYCHKINTGIKKGWWRAAGRCVLDLRSHSSLWNEQPAELTRPFHRSHVFSIAARYCWPLRSLPSRLGSKQIDFRKRIPFCFCGAILQYCGFELCSLELWGWFRGALGLGEVAVKGRAGRGEDFLPTTPPLTSTARALLWSVSCTWIPHQFSFAWETVWL